MMRHVSPVCNHPENTDIMLPLMEFIKTFVESHMERCLDTPNRFIYLGESLILPIMSGYNAANIICILSFLKMLL